MTGTSKAFDAAVYLVVALGIWALAAWADMHDGAGNGPALIGFAAGMTFFVLALRAAWSSRA